MSLATFIFYFFEGLAAGSAVGILFIRNVFYGALLLIVCLLSLAGIYVLAFAEFLAISQILIYAGGILVVIIFGIMFTSRISGKPLIVTNTRWIAGAVVGGFFFALLINLFSMENFTMSASLAKSSSFNSVQQIGITLMSDFVLPFEIIGLLLLVALIGAAITASSIKRT